MNSTTTPTTFDFDAEIETIEFPVLTLQDRCDRDPAEAAVAQVRLPSGHTLLFCGHHFLENYEQLHRYPHTVPESHAKPLTWARAAELGPVSRSQGDDHA